MTPELQAAAIGAGAALIGSWLGARGALAAARAQTDRETAHRRADWFRDELISGVSEILGAVDPEVHGRPEYDKAVRQIHRVQLLLDLTEPTHSTLNHWLNMVGRAGAAHYLVTGEPSEERDASAASLLGAQGQLLEATRAVLRNDRTE